MVEQWLVWEDIKMDIKKNILDAIYSGIASVTTGDPTSFYKMQIAEEQRQQQAREAKIREAIDITNLSKASWTPGYQSITLPTGQQLKIPTGKTLYGQAQGEKVAEEKRDFTYWNLKSDSDFEKQKKLKEIDYQYHIKVRNLPSAPKDLNQWEFKASQVDKFFNTLKQIKNTKDPEGMMTFLSNPTTKRVMQENEIQLDSSELQNIVDLGNIGAWATAAYGTQVPEGYKDFAKQFIDYQTPKPDFTGKEANKNKELFYKELYKGYGL